MPTLRDVAKCAGVSLTTASYVINNKGSVSEPTRQRVFQAVRELGYTRRAPLSKQIALIGYTPRGLTQWITHACAEYGFQLTEIQINRDGPVNPDIFQDFAGAIMYGGLWANHCFDTVTRHIPTVFLGGSYPCNQSDGVWVDNTSAVYLALHHLISIGHRRIGLVNGPKGTITTGEKQLGFERALHDFPQVSGLSIEADDFDEASGYQAFERLHKLFPDMTAVVSAEVDLTLGIITYCLAANISVGKSISLISLRDAPALTSSNPPVTAFSTPDSHIARAAEEQLVTRINTPGLTGRRLLLVPNKIARQSVIPPAKEVSTARIASFPTGS